MPDPCKTEPATVPATAPATVPSPIPLLREIEVAMSRDPRIAWYLPEGVTPGHPACPACGGPTVERTCEVRCTRCHAVI
jgi:hypothetical protein